MYSSYSPQVVNFLLASSAMIAVLYGVYLLVRQNPQSLTRVLPNRRSGDKERQLTVTSSLTLEPRKKLYVIGYGQERFLVSTSGEQTTLLSPLASSLGITEAEFALTELNSTENHSAMSLPEGWDAPPENCPRWLAPLYPVGQRLLMSMRWIIEERFSQTRGR